VDSPAASSPGRRWCCASWPAASSRPGLLLAAGVLAASGTGAVPLLLGEPLLTAGKTSLRLPVIGAWIGEVALSTTLLFEAGVYAVVLGLVQTLLRTLGSDSEEHQ
jgi:multicomponent Na+:H+ antiporter subunit A